MHCQVLLNVIWVPPSVIWVLLSVIRVPPSVIRVPPSVIWVLLVYCAVKTALRNKQVKNFL